MRQYQECRYVQKLESSTQSRPLWWRAEAPSTFFRRNCSCLGNIHFIETFHDFCWIIVDISKLYLYFYRRQSARCSWNSLRNDNFRIMFPLCSFCAIWGKDYDHTTYMITLKFGENNHRYIPRNMRIVLRDTHVNKYVFWCNLFARFTVKRGFSAISGRAGSTKLTAQSDLLKLDRVETGTLTPVR